MVHLEAGTGGQAQYLNVQHHHSARVMAHLPLVIPLYLYSGW